MAVIRQRTTVFNKPVGVVRTDGGSQQLGNAISQAASGLQRIAYNQASSEAQKKGMEVAQAAEESRITTINPETGKPEAYTAPETFGVIAAEAYQRVVDKRYETSMNRELKLKSQEIAIKYPLDEASYNDIMSDYIAQMSENAEGKYKQFIQNTGEAWLAETGLNIKTRVQAKAREDAGNSVIDNIDELGMSLLNASANNGIFLRQGETISQSDRIIEEAVELAKDAVDAGLLDTSYINDTKEKLEAIAARGAIEQILSETIDSTERSQLEISIMSGGSNLSGLSSSVKKLMKAVKKYITPTNKNGLVAYARSSSVSYNSIEADRVAARKKIFQKEVNDLFENADTTAEMTNNIATKSMLNMMLPVGFDGATTEDYFKAATDLLNDRLKLVSNNPNNLFAIDKLKLSEKNKYIKDQRHAMLRPFAVQATLDGNVEELQLALASVKSGILNLPKKLTTNQQEFIKALNRADWYDADEDFDFVNKLLETNIDSNKKEAQDTKTKIVILEQIRNFESAASKGQQPEEDFAKIMASINNNINLFESKEIIKSKSNMETAYARGFLNQFSTNAAAKDINNLGLALRLGLSEGQPDPKFNSIIPKQIKMLASSVLNIVKTDEQIRSLASHLSALESAKSEEENKYAKEQLEIIQQTRVNSGGGNADLIEDRKRADNRVEAFGFSYSQYNSLSETQQKALIDLAVSAPSQKYLINDLNALARGDVIQGADSLLNVFTILYDYPTATDPNNAVLRDVFKQSLSGPVKQFLLDVNSIKRNSNESTQTIAATLYDRTTGPTAQAKLQSVFGESKNEEDFVMSLGIKGMNNITAQELGPVATYLALTGKNQEQITERINDIIEKEYAESKHVIDPQLNFGSMKLTRHSLEATIPNEEERNFFINDYVEANLPDGYSLYADNRKAEVSNTAAYSVFAQSQKDLDDLASEIKEKQVYLVPHETVQGVEYYTYFVDNNNELRPLYYEKEIFNGPLERTDTELTWPKFSKNSQEMNEFRSKAAEKQKQEDDALVIREEEKRRKNLLVIKQFQELSNYGDSNN